MKIEPDSITYLNEVFYRLLPNSPLGTLHGTTPSVSNCEFFIGDGTVVTITNFTKGSDCQRIHILGNGSITISNNANIKTNTGANKLLSSNKVYRFTLFNNIWYEDE